LKRFGSAADLAAYLLETTGVAMVPGEAFGVDGHLRISYAVPKEQLIEGLEKIGGAL
jgi:aspartate aminotransferase